MSWLQSSLGFVNSALSQAQKSIDKVLDISEVSDLSTKESNQSIQSQKGYGDDHQEPVGDESGGTSSSFWSMATPTKQETSSTTASSLRHSTPAQPESDSFWNSFFDSPMRQSTTSPTHSKSSSPPTRNTRETPTPGKTSSGKQKPLPAKHKQKQNAETKATPLKNDGSVVEEKEQEVESKKNTDKADNDVPFAAGEGYTTGMDSVGSHRSDESDGTSKTSESQIQADLPCMIHPEILPPAPIQSHTDEYVANLLPPEVLNSTATITEENSDVTPHVSQTNSNDVAENQDGYLKEDSKSSSPVAPDLEESRVNITDTSQERTDTDVGTVDLSVRVSEESVMGTGDCLSDGSREQPVAQLGTVEVGEKKDKEDEAIQPRQHDTPVEEEQTNSTSELPNQMIPLEVSEERRSQGSPACQTEARLKEPYQSDHFATPEDSEIEDSAVCETEGRQDTESADGPELISNQQGQTSVPWEELRTVTPEPIVECPVDEVDVEREREPVEQEDVNSSEHDEEVGTEAGQDQLFVTPSASLPSSTISHSSKVDGLVDEIKMLQNELEETKHVLTVRERKLLELSQLNAALNEENDTLRSELAFTPAKQQGEEEGGIEELKDEFARRIASVEKKLQNALKEKETLRKEIHSLKTEKNAMGSKDDEIAGLRAEGDKLAKQQLQNSETIKKLRKKEQENSKLISNLKKNVNVAEEEITKLKETLQKKEESERQLQENLAKLNSFAEQQAFELSTVKDERGELVDKARSLQANLDSVYKEMAELKKANAASENAVKEATLSAEQSAKGELKALLEQHKRDHQQEKDILALQIADLRAGLSRSEQQASWREDQLRQEITTLQSRLQEAEARNEDLSSSVSQATKPLLRQLENVQNVHATQVANWEKVESNLTERLNLAQGQLNQVVEKERAAAEKEATLQSRVASLEAQVKSLRTEKAKLAAELEAERVKLSATEDGNEKITVKLESLKATYLSTTAQLKKEKESLEHRLEFERTKFESELKRASAEARETERKKLTAEMASTSVKRQSSSSDTFGQTRSETTSRSVSMDNSGSFWESSFSRTTPSASTAPLVEHFQSQLRQKEGELTNSQKLVTSLEKSRSALMEEVTKLTTQNSVLERQASSIPDLEAKLKDLETRYDALLQMYGEKSEEAEELRLDLQDVKEMYKQQIEDLVGN